MQTRTPNTTRKPYSRQDLTTKSLTAVDILWIAKALGYSVADTTDLKARLDNGEVLSNSIARFAKDADLNALVTNGSGWALTNALGISQRGLILATGLLSGQQRNALLTPRPPQPTSPPLAALIQTRSLLEQSGL